MTNKVAMPNDKMADMLEMWLAAVATERFWAVVKEWLKGGGDPYAPETCADAIDALAERLIGVSEFKRAHKRLMRAPRHVGLGLFFRTMRAINMLRASMPGETVLPAPFDIKDAIRMFVVCGVWHHMTAPAATNN